MKSILVALEDDAGAQALLETTLLAAVPFGSHVDGIAPRSINDINFYGEGMPTAALEQWDRDEKLRIERTRAAFREFMSGREVAWGDPLKPSDTPTADWIEDVTPGDGAIGQLARLYDLTVLPRPSTDVSTRRHQILETVLFESGRPVLVAPEDTPTSLGQVIVIAWNGSTESARSLAFARPYLLRADRVHVLAVKGGMVAGPDAAQVERTLRRLGVAAETIVAEPGSRSIGEVILSEAAAVGADLLVKGAYTHSRLRQMIFGGATSHILHQARIPVLMVH